MIKYLNPSEAGDVWHRTNLSSLIPFKFLKAIPFYYTLIIIKFYLINISDYFASFLLFSRLAIFMDSDRSEPKND